MTRRRTIQEIEEIIKINNYSYIEDYYEGEQRRVIILDSFGYKHDVLLSSIINNKNPEKFSIRNPFTLYNIDLWLKLNNSVYSLIDNQYAGYHNKMKFHCPKCNDIFYCSLGNILRGDKCGVCDGNQTGEHHSLSDARPDLAREWSDRNNKKPNEIVMGTNTSFWWRCLKCGHEWQATPNTRVRMKTGCKKCASSKGEKIIKTFLDYNEIKYVFQHKFQDCIDKRKLPFDFYLLDYNICVEYDGEFHYELSRFVNKKKATERLKNIHRRDRIKTNYCKKNNIRLIRIPYWEFDNIEQILTKELLGREVYIA